MIFKTTAVLLTLLTTTTIANSCIDLDIWETDSGLDGCLWYDSNPGSCGNWDDSDFTASDLCCACGGGAGGMCYDSTYGAKDVGGDGCGYYDWYPSECGWWDDYDFSASSMCCACSSSWDICHDTEYDSTGDITSDGCSWYSSYPSSCGNWDDSDFTARDMCCACSGGAYGNNWWAAQNLSTSSTCVDTNYGATDVGTDGCAWYDSYTSSCGVWDDSDFTANSMCCSCGGGSSFSTCQDSTYGATDTTNDGCEWYESYPDTCGWYDDWDFSASSMCCACHSTACHSTDYTSNGDVTGDGCAWYETYPSSCGWFDDSDFSANEMCCACQGGSTLLAVTLSSSSTCYDVDFWSDGDLTGDGCAWYDNYPSSCGYFDDDDFNANIDCCACGGGAQIEECFDMDFFSTGDITGDGCSWYDTYPSSCGYYDDDDFNAGNDCCACGGGESWFNANLSLAATVESSTTANQTNWMTTSCSIIALMFVSFLVYTVYSKKEEKSERQTDVTEELISKL